MGIKSLFTKANMIISHVVWIMLSNLPIEMYLHKFFGVYLDYNLQITSVSDYNLHEHPKRKRTKKKPNTNRKKWWKQIKLSRCGNKRTSKPRSRKWNLIDPKDDHDTFYGIFNVIKLKQSLTLNFSLKKSLIHHQERWVETPLDAQNIQTKCTQ